MKTHQLALINYRLSRANEDYAAAEALIKAENNSAVINRIYYSVFHATRALFVFDGFKTKKHSSVLTYFSKTYVKTGIFDKKYARMLHDMEKYRAKSDYEDFFDPSSIDIAKQLLEAQKFITIVTQYIKQRLENE